ncbi:MAG: helix-turn-helix domain-containing protein [Oscillospiraceae bacterium]|jgi:transcriptional regulator with XRE-family HTH domain|nr:helix-turn-helix domain-containing protein [Oscillospiraceae bacterium]
MEIGKIIKNLRREREFTQEELAELLGVTSQAVSKWESGAGLPDISQVIPLASIFGVSIDALFGTSGATDDEAVDALIQAAVETARRGSLIEAVYSYREMLKKYPTNLKALEFAYQNSFMAVENAFGKLRDGPHYPNHPDATEAELHEAARECARICKQFLTFGKGHAMYLPVTIALIKMYAILGRTDEARELAETFSPPERNRVLAEMHRYGGDLAEELRLREKSIRDARKTLAGEYALFAAANELAGDFERAVGIWQKYLDSSEGINKILGHSFVAMNYARLGNLDACFKWLDSMFETAIEICSEPPEAGETRLAPHSILNSELNFRPDFKQLRGDPRFAALLARLDELEDWWVAR